MIDTMNHGRVSQALLIYKTATRRFIARVLKSENGGAGDWFGDLVLAKLRAEKRGRLEHALAESEEELAANGRGGGSEGEGPERLLEETHFPDIVNENWGAFRHALREDRSLIVRQLRQIKKYRDKKNAHNSEELSHKEAHEIIEACRLIVERFDTSAAAQLEELRNWPEPEDDFSGSVSEDALAEAGSDLTGASPGLPTLTETEDGDEEDRSQSEEDIVTDSKAEGAPGPGGEESVWDGAKRFELEREGRQARLDKLIRQFGQVWKEQNQIDELKATLEARSIEIDLDDAWEELHSLWWLEIAPELVSAAFDTMYGGFGVEGTEDGWKMDFSARGGSEEVYLQISFSFD